MTVTPLGGGRYEIISDTGRTLAFGVRRGNETWVFINGETWIIDAQRTDLGAPVVETRRSSPLRCRRPS